MDIYRFGQFTSSVTIESGSMLAPTIHNVQVVADLIQLLQFYATNEDDLLVASNFTSESSMIRRKSLNFPSLYCNLCSLIMSLKNLCETALTKLIADLDIRIVDGLQFR